MIPKIEILKINKVQPGLFEPQESYEFIKCLDCKKEIVKIWDYYINRYNEDKNSLAVNYDSFCCRKCNDYAIAVSEFIEQEEQEINERDQILEIEYIDTIHKKESKKNSLVKIKTVLDITWISGTKKEVDKVKKYVTNCGEQYEYISHTLTEITALHKDCRVCKLIAKMSKAKKIYDYEIKKLFEYSDNIDHVVESNNYKLEDNCLYHRRDIEFIKRKKDKLIINNSQEIHFQSGYFGRSVCCPRFWRSPFNKRIVRLPLTQIQEIVNNQCHKTLSIIELVEQIEILENKDIWSFKEINGTLIKVFDKYMWFKRDEAQECLIVLPCKVTSIKQAVESLKPKLLENKTKGFTRIGDYFFIETKEDFKQYDKSHYKVSDYNIIDHYGNIQEIEEIKKIIIEQFKEKLNINPEVNEVTLRFLERLCIDQDKYKNDKEISELINRIFRELNPVKIKGDLVKYPIYDSNHIATNSFNLGPIQFVKGFMYHRSREHRRVKLDNWHLVLKNEAVEAFNVSANSGAYRD